MERPPNSTELVGNYREAVPQAPEALYKDPLAAKHIAAALRHLEPAFNPTGGNTANVLKPHMFVPRRLVNKKSLDKEDISFPLCVNSMAGMILNAMPDHRSRPAALCRHLREVAKNVAVRPWPVARECSKATIDKLNIMEITWADYSEIQHDRMHINMMYVPPEKAIYPCALYQNLACEEPDSHLVHSQTG